MRRYLKIICRRVSRRLPIFFSCLVFILMFGISINLLLKSSSSGQILGDNKKSAYSVVSASVGEFRFTLFGYSSPQAQITFEGMGIYDQTIADNNGYFIFKNRFSPFSPREACLIAKDQLGRLSPPVCLPPFPTNVNAFIGPVILPPTVSLGSGDYYMGDEIVLSGQTIPNTKVELSLFVDEKRSLIRYFANKLSPIRSVNAFYFPQLSIKSDNKGNFSISIPSDKPDYFRLFAQTSYSGSPSPNSVILNVRVFPLWMIIIKMLLFIFSFIRPHLLEIVIILEIVAVTFYLFRRYFHFHPIAKNRALEIKPVSTLLYPKSKGLN